MKTLYMLAISSVFAICVGCFRIDRATDIDDPWTDHGRYVTTKVVKIEGHRYILMDGHRSGGIVHAESCPCRTR